LYFNLQREVTAPRVQLPSKLRDEIRTKLVLAATTNGYLDNAQLCCLYLRQKGRHKSNNITDFRRDGSSLGDYLPALRLLTQAGFQVLLTGDVALDPRMSQQFCGLLVDSKSLKVDKELLDLFAATEAEIFIGEAGGGVWLPGLNNIPCLLLNAFPYGFGLPNSWVYYKTVRDASGELVHYSKLFSDHILDYELAGMTLHHNNRDEIYRAVSCFLEDIAHPEKVDPNAYILSQLPDHAMIKQARARLSPAWLELFEVTRLDEA
jgi:putative glycosyltransferase (TIGR04372 family)